MTSTTTTSAKADTKLKKVQYEFAANLRDPKRNKTPADIEDRRMEIYRDLFYRNVEGFISNSFPVLRKLYSDDDWHKMVRDFFPSINPLRLTSKIFLKNF